VRAWCEVREIFSGPDDRHAAILYTISTDGGVVCSLKTPIVRA
jgi:hypothetical protein